MKRARRTNNNTNPLSTARSSSSSNTTAKKNNSNNNKHDFYQELWHKKSGLGYAVFVQYYGQQQQPSTATSGCVGGIIASAQSLSSSSSLGTFPQNQEAALTASLKTSTATTSTTTTGMSRASKRRQRKKKGAVGMISGGDCDNKGGGCEQPLVSYTHVSSNSLKKPSTLSSSTRSSSLLQQHRLLQELDRHPVYDSYLRPFVQAMSQPLPLTFRLRSVVSSTVDSTMIQAQQQQQLQNELQQSFSEYCTPRFVRFGVGGDNVASTGFIYYQAHSSFSSSSVLHKNALGSTCPALKELLIQASSQGLVARQELGSMLPVWGLSHYCFNNDLLHDRDDDDDPTKANRSETPNSMVTTTTGSSSTSGTRRRRRPTDDDRDALIVVVDVCASPGSKTLQLLEMVGQERRSHNINKRQDDDHHDANPSRNFIVIANDVHPQRLDTLRQAVQRSGMDHLDRIVFTNYDAADINFPQYIMSTLLSSSSSSSSLLQPPPSKSRQIQQQEIQQRRQRQRQQHCRPQMVVCDVPCSGDGTIRKDPKTILSSWSPVTARALHPVQCRILHRALELVQVGGIVSYSTCSLNPIENEAVVQTVLKLRSRSGDDDAVELLEWPPMDGLILREGVTSWKVLDYQQDKDDDDCDSDDGNDADAAAAVARRWKEYPSFEDARDVMVHCYPTLWPTNDNNNNNSHINNKKMEILRRCRRLWPQDQDSGGFFVALLRKRKELLPCNKK